MNGIELLGLIGVYVHDFLMAGCDDDPNYSAACRNSKEHEDNLTSIPKFRHFLMAAVCNLRQQKFVDQLELMSLSQSHSRAYTDKLTPGELT